MSASRWSVALALAVLVLPAALAGVPHAAAYRGTVDVIRRDPTGSITCATNALGTVVLSEAGAATVSIDAAGCADYRSAFRATGSFEDGWSFTELYPSPTSTYEATLAAGARAWFTFEARLVEPTTGAVSTATANGTLASFTT